MKGQKNKGISMNKKYANGFVNVSLPSSPNMLSGISDSFSAQMLE